MLARRAARMLPAAITPSSTMRASMISPLSTSTARVSPMPRSTSHSGKPVPRRLQQHASLGEREADHVRIAAGDVPDIDFTITLERVAAGLAAPFAVRGVISDLFIGQALHRDHRLDQPLAKAAAGNHQRDAGE